MTWTSVDLLSKGFCGIYMGAILHEVLMIFTHYMCSEITLLNLMPCLPGISELICSEVLCNVAQLLVIHIEIC